MTEIVTYRGVERPSSSSALCGLVNPDITANRLVAMSDALLMAAMERGDSLPDGIRAGYKNEWLISEADRGTRYNVHISQVVTSGAFPDPDSLSERPSRVQSWYIPGRYKLEENRGGFEVTPTTHDGRVNFSWTGSGGNSGSNTPPLTADQEARTQQIFGELTRGRRPDAIITQSASLIFRGRGDERKPDLTLSAIKTHYPNAGAVPKSISNLIIDASINNGQGLFYAQITGEGLDTLSCELTPTSGQVLEASRVKTPCNTDCEYGKLASSEKCWLERQYYDEERPEPVVPEYILKEVLGIGQSALKTLIAPKALR